MIRKTPLKAIRAKLCPATDCDLYPYRMGKKPGIKSNNPRGNPEALRKYQESQKALSWWSTPRFEPSDSVVCCAETRVTSLSKPVRSSSVRCTCTAWEGVLIRLKLGSGRIGLVRKWWQMKRVKKGKKRGLKTWKKGVLKHDFSSVRETNTIFLNRFRINLQ